MNYYNEFDPKAAQWLRNLISGGMIPPGDVDERSITEVKADDLKKYTQCHFFAGIGGWSLALELAGWPADRPVWTGSCPCQPFSAAGKQKGKEDERHLWPVWFNLIRECRPEAIFGEQVSSSEVVGQELETSFTIAVQRGDFAEANRIANKLVKQAGFAASSRWLDDVYQGLEAEGYACGSAVLPACSVGAPHKRDRLFFVAHAEQLASDQRCELHMQRGRQGNPEQAGVGGVEQFVAHAECFGQPRSRELGQSCDTAQSGVGKTNWSDDDSARHWQNGIWIDCPDGKQRLVEPSIPLLDHGVPARVAKLRALGNAIVPQVAAEFIAAFNKTL